MTRRRPITVMALYRALPRFDAFVDRRADDECWEWKGCRHPDGHGKFSVRGRTQYAHRIAWAIAHGRLPGRQLVRHRCGNEGCVNPSHLVVGDHSSNLLDQYRNGERDPFEATSHLNGGDR